MARLLVLNSVTLDGVMQAPARPDEDTRGGFTHGGWAIPYNDAVMAQIMGEGMAQSAGGSLLFGRRTYMDFYSVWPNRTDNPFTPVLNATQKYVASTTLEEPLPWSNSTLLKGDVAEAVANLKEQAEKDIMIMGSGELIQTLMRSNLIDEVTLLIHPLVLGTGRRLFADGGAPASFRLIKSVPTTTGVIIATYQLVEPPAGTP
ncbi:MAG TPA: dihydrofolate reductase family protein [Ktedonobacterales bacterium]|nr:dihydrofolate reductase family protein [Ktedonobacterales bacterium]